MPIQQINIGAAPDDGTGDTLRDALGKVNTNYASTAIILPITTESTTARTLGLADNKTYIRLTHASGCAITIPNQATVAWLDETEIVFRVAAAVAPSFTLGGSVVLNTSSPTLGQHSNFALKRVAENVWDLV